MAKELKTVEQTSNSPAEMIRMAVAGNANLDQLEKLLNLQEKWEGTEAKKAYNKAMSDFKANPPKINKDKKVGYKTTAGNVGYSHASLYNVTNKINSDLSKYGLSASWTTKQNGMIVVTCRITHVKGHSEETTLSAPSDTTGSKNAIQAIGSTISYLCRYTLLCLTGLATYDQDDDGIIGGKSEEKIGEKEKGIILDYYAALGMEKDHSKFLKFMGVETTEDILLSDFPKAKAALEAKKDKGAK